MKFVDELLLALGEGLRSNNLRSCSRWAEHRRVMGAPFNGPYSFARHPWCREIHDSQAAWTVAMKAAQLGVTETGINRAFFTLDQSKRDVLYVLPTTLNASDFSKARFATALKLSEYLKSLFVDTNTVGLKSTGTNVLYIRGSRGDSNLKFIPVSELVLDELDEMDTHAVWLALERLSGQVEKHILAISTPTVPKYGIHKLYLDQHTGALLLSVSALSADGPNWSGRIAWRSLANRSTIPAARNRSSSARSASISWTTRPSRSSWPAASGRRRSRTSRRRNRGAFTSTSFTRPR